MCVHILSPSHPPCPITPAMLSPVVNGMAVYSKHFQSKATSDIGAASGPGCSQPYHSHPPCAIHPCMPSPEHRHGQLTSNLDFPFPLLVLLLLFFGFCREAPPRYELVAGSVASASKVETTSHKQWAC